MKAVSMCSHLICMQPGPFSLILSRLYFTHPDFKHVVHDRDAPLRTLHLHLLPVLRTHATAHAHVARVILFPVATHTYTCS